MRRFTLTIITLLTLTLQAMAADLSFSYEKFTLKGNTLQYRKAFIEGAEAKPLLVLWLHGGSCKGSDNEKQLTEVGIDSVCNYLVRNNHSAIVIAPQCPSDKSWGGVMTGVLRALVLSYTDDSSADADRMYILGGSMGGTGTWTMLSTCPELFAAAMPVAGNPSGCDAEKVAQTPLFTVMGTADAIMKIPTVEAFLTNMDTFGAEYRMETEEGWTHEDTCTRSYTTNRLDWVFSHSRSTTAVDNIEQETAVPTSVVWFDLSGCRLSSAPSSHGVFIRQTTYDNGDITREKTITYASKNK